METNAIGKFAKEEILTTGVKKNTIFHLNDDLLRIRIYTAECQPCRRALVPDHVFTVDVTKLDG
ncbi:hypothetical protein KP79_PYT12764 [Mizuhopecten yessoensis]|uniref:Uncharacterized protein n=1 Tax=Mizuhopecten yessoensis TaxID=6573 RepID=A0A210Q9B0_MIZYE|nr:hypothetical protein KP79_PYT12764 [Mizuhopecten yessoensis]